VGAPLAADRPFLAEGRREIEAGLATASGLPRLCPSPAGYPISYPMDLAEPKEPNKHGRFGAPAAYSKTV
jgi:hypothetical protein